MTEKAFDKIILASASPRRHELLNQIQVEHVVEVSDIEEDMDKSLSVEEFVKSLSVQKAKAVAERHINENVAVIGADTVVALNGKIFGKPGDKQSAVNMLKALSGNTHCVITGVTVINPLKNQIVTEAVKTDVTFGELSDSEIEWYVATGEPMDKAGAYGVQGLGAKFVEKISGDFYNVVGLPIYRVSAILKILGGK